MHILVHAICTCIEQYIYIILTKREGRTGRISARDLDRTDHAAYGPYKIDREPMFNGLPVQSRARLVNKKYITRPKIASHLGGSRNPPNRIMLLKAEISVGLIGQ